MCSEFHLEVQTEPLNVVYMNLEHKSLRTWKNEWSVLCSLRVLFCAVPSLPADSLEEVPALRLTTLSILHMFFTLVSNTISSVPRFSFV
jgi:hypothetical protein